MKRTMFRAGALGLSGVVVAALAVAGATTASAATYAPVVAGTATGVPASGSTTVAFNLKTSAACPAGTGVVQAFIDNTAAGWTGIIAIGTNDTDVANVNTTGVPMSDTLAGIASSNGKTLSNGTYDISLVCLPDAFSSPTVQFDGQFTVTGTAYAFAAAPAASSSTSLSASATSLNPGDSVTLTATVTSTAAVAGTVDFKEGATTLGSGTISGGTATFTTTASALGGGSHSITATFVPTDPAVVAGSTSSPVTITVNVPAQTTTTTLTSSPSSPTTADVITLTAGLSPTSAVGTVSFTEGATVVGTAAVSGGTASVSLTGVSAGSHTYTATFNPTNPASYTTSTSSPLTISVTTFAGASDTETIVTTVGAGTLTITAGGPVVDLGPATLNAANTLLVTAPKDINTVTVTDTRAGQLGYTVNGQASDFVSGANGINSENLGWTPKKLDGPAGVTPGPVVPPANGVALSDTGTAGLKSAKLLATAAAGDSIGTAHLSATLVLQAPTSTPAGLYTSTLTLTAI